MEFITTPITTPSKDDAIPACVATCVTCHMPNEHILPCCGPKTGLCALCQSQPDPATGLVTCLMCGLKYNGRDYSVPVVANKTATISPPPHFEMSSTSVCSSKLKQDDTFNQSFGVDNQNEIELLKEKNRHLAQTVACLSKEKECLSGSLLRREKMIASLLEQLRQGHSPSSNGPEEEVISGLNKGQCQELVTERYQLCQQLSEASHFQKTVGNLKVQIDQKVAEIRQLREKMATSREGPIIAIDIGTSKSCIAFTDKDGKVLTIPNENDETSVSSSINLAASNLLESDVGTEQENTDVSNMISCIKRLLTLNYDDAVKQAKRLSWHFSLLEGKRSAPELAVPCRPGETFTPLELCAILFGKLKRQTERYFADNGLNQKISDVVIVVPAHFGDSQRQIVIDAAATAGLNVFRLINETIALFANYERRVLRLKEFSSPESLLVVSMGSGVTETAYFEYNRTLESFDMTSCHAASIGGEDIDSLLMQCCRSEWKQFLDAECEHEILSQIKQKCQQAKEKLSTSSGVKQAEIQVNLRNGSTLALTVTKARFDGLITGFVLPEFKKLISKTTNGRVPGEIVLSGGSMRIPSLIHCIQGMFPGAPICQTVNYSEAAAHGAAICAAKLARQIPIVHTVIPLELDCFLKHTDPESKKGHCWRVAECVSLPCNAKFTHSWPPETLDENASNFTFTVRQNKKVIGSSRLKDGTRLGDLELFVDIDENGVITDLRAAFFNQPESTISIEKENDGLTKNQSRRIIAKFQRLQQQKRQPAAENKEDRMKMQKLVALFEDQTFTSNISAAPIG